MAAIAIGLLAGVFCFLMVVSVKARFGYDDSPMPWSSRCRRNSGRASNWRFRRIGHQPHFKDGQGNPLTIRFVSTERAQLLNQAAE
jgi:Amt family ammonium transporter